MNVIEKYRKLKLAAGSHQPSIESIKTQIPELKIIVDACFLSNPYATELFIDYFTKELIETKKINKIVEFYPSQNNAIAKILSESINVESSRIFVCNGAVEAIQAILHNYVSRKIVINIPTFSSYYEYVKKETEVIYYKLLKENNFKFDPDNYIDFVKNSEADSVVLINPNNPDGGYINIEKIKYIVGSLTHLKNIIIDESFIHFAYEDKEFHLKSFVPFIENYRNISIIKSMSKDFGVAGLRCGYAILPENRTEELNSNGYLWNLNRIAEWNLSDEEANTIAGLLIYEAQAIPAKGQVFSFDGYRFEVIEKDSNRLTKLKINKL